MNRRNHPIATYLAFIVAGGCVGSDRQDIVTKCFGQALNQNWVTAGLDVDVSSPDRCPFMIATGLTKQQDFNGIVTGNNQYVGSLGYVTFDQLSALHVRVFNHQNSLVNTFVPPVYNFQGNPARAAVQVTYTAGTAGYKNAFDTKGTDNGIMDVSLRDQSGAQGLARLTFSYEVFPTAVIGPISAVAGTNFSLSTSASNYRAPLRYKWWKSGTLLSTTSSSIGGVAPSAGVSVTYKVEVTDADGDKGSDTHAVSAYPGAGDGGGGGGCLVLEDSTSSPGSRHLGDTVTSNALPCP